jgi:hypothetical protein
MTDWVVNENHKLILCVDSNMVGRNIVTDQQCFKKLKDWVSTGASITFKHDLLEGQLHTTERLMLMFPSIRHILVFNASSMIRNNRQVCNFILSLQRNHRVCVNLKFNKFIRCCDGVLSILPLVEKLTLRKCGCPVFADRLKQLDWIQGVSRIRKLRFVIRKNLVDNTGLEAKRFIESLDPPLGHRYDVSFKSGKLVFYRQGKPKFLYWGPRIDQIIIYQQDPPPDKVKQIISLIQFTLEKLPLEKLLLDLGLPFFNRVYLRLTS